MDNANREMEPLRKNKKEIIEINKNTITKIEDEYYGLVSRLGIDKGSINNI